MIPIMQRIGLIALVGAAMLAFIADRALARTPYDGVWSVLIQTDSGPCDRGYRYPIQIRNGKVTYAGEADVNLVGRVDGKGRVTVRVSRGAQWAAGSGRLRGNTGGGRWKGVGSAGNCSGVWSTDKRGG